VAEGLGGYIELAASMVQQAIKDAHPLYGMRPEWVYECTWIKSGQVKIQVFHREQHDAKKDPEIHYVLIHKVCREEAAETCKELLRPGTVVRRLAEAYWAETDPKRVRDWFNLHRKRTMTR